MNFLQKIREKWETRCLKIGKPQLQQANNIVLRVRTITYQGTPYKIGVVLSSPKGSSYKGNSYNKGEILIPKELNKFRHILEPILKYEGHQLWKCEVTEGITDGLKSATTRCKTIHRIPIPIITIKQRIKFAILCAKQVCRNKKWLRWANDWLSGKDRSNATAYAIYTNVSNIAASLAAYITYAPTSYVSASHAAESATHYSKKQINFVAIAHKCKEKK